MFDNLLKIYINIWIGINDIIFYLTEKIKLWKPVFVNFVMIPSKAGKIKSSVMTLVAAHLTIK